MENQIIQYITRYIDLTPEETALINAQNQIKTFTKDTLLLREGAFAKECYFILKGCIRSFYLVDGEERTTALYTENQGVHPVSYLTNEASAYYLSCLEDCVLAISTADMGKKLLQAVPKLQQVLLQMSSELLIQNQTDLDHFKNLSPEERYLHLLETRPDLLKRVPLQHIATYLGITPVSLSRMRKRITTGNKANSRYLLTKDNFLEKLYQ